LEQPHILYSWQVSYFGGKVRSYLRYKGIPFVEKSPNIFNYYVSLPRKTGVAAIPVVVTPTGQWLQDSSVIIDHFETRTPEKSVVPATPVHRFLAYLFELWGDEFWIPTGLITRWCHMEENYPFLERDVANDLLPGFPQWLQKKAARKVASQMSGYLERTGVIPEQYDMLNRWTVSQLDALNSHFEKHPYLLGNRASLGDFGLMAPLYGHLSRDPWPAAHLIEPRAHLKAWIARMNLTSPAVGDFLSDTEIPQTLTPLITTLFAELLPYLEGTIKVAQPCFNQTGVLPRFMDEITFPLAGQTYRRRAMPYGLWMLQRLQRACLKMSDAEINTLRLWLRGHGAERILDIRLPSMQLKGLQAQVIATLPQ
jgi:glutathione S-transferase